MLQVFDYRTLLNGEQFFHLLEHQKETGLARQLRDTFCVVVGQIGGAEHPRCHHQSTTPQTFRPIQNHLRLHTQSVRVHHE